MNLDRMTRLMLYWIQCRCSYCLLLFDTIYYLLQEGLEEYYITAYVYVFQFQLWHAVSV